MQGGGVAILMRSNIKINIIDTCSSLDTDNEVTTIFLKDLQFSTSMSVIYILPTPAINTTLLNNIKNSVDNINWRSQRKTHRPQLFPIDEKTDKWVIVLKKKNADLFIAGNSKPAHGYSRTNTSDIIDYIRAFIKSRDPFLKSALNAISKKKSKNKKLPECRYPKENSDSSAYNQSKKLENAEGYPSKGSSSSMRMTN